MNGRSHHEPYDEEKLAHQEPVQAISAWQQWNDPSGAESVAFEMDLMELEKYLNLGGQGQ